MAKDSDPLADAFGAKETGGLFSGLVAEESSFDRGMMWRLGSWGVAAVRAVVLAVFPHQGHAGAGVCAVFATRPQLGGRRDQVASADLARQADRLQILTKESQNEARRLASAIETLNTDRDRLYSRVTVLEQGLDSVTGAIAKQTTTPPQASIAKPQDAPALIGPPTPGIGPVASPPAPANDKRRTEAAKEPSSPPPQSAAAASLVAQSPATNSALPMLPLVPSKSIMAPPDPAAPKLVQPEAAEKTTEKAAEKKPDPVPAPVEVAAAPAKPPEAAESEAPAIAVQQTRFAIDLGGANSLE